MLGLALIKKEALRPLKLSDLPTSIAGQKFSLSIPPLCILASCHLFLHYFEEPDGIPSPTPHTHTTSPPK